VLPPDYTNYEEMGLDHPHAGLEFHEKVKLGSSKRELASKKKAVFKRAQLHRSTVHDVVHKLQADVVHAAECIASAQGGNGAASVQSQSVEKVIKKMFQRLGRGDVPAEALARSLATLEVRVSPFQRDQLRLAYESKGTGLLRLADFVNECCALAAAGGGGGGGGGGRGRGRGGGDGAVRPRVLRRARPQV
jgi:hypothetical protein